MAFHQFSVEQHVAADLEQVWEFISSPSNLKKITPKEMGFDITSKEDNAKVYPGMIITYKVSPSFGHKNELDDRNHSGKRKGLLYRRTKSGTLQDVASPAQTDP